MVILKLITQKCHWPVVRNKTFELTTVVKSLITIRGGGACPVRISVGIMTLQTGGVRGFSSAPPIRIPGTVSRFEPHPFHFIMILTFDAI
jgi:hypothetical protein